MELDDVYCFKLRLMTIQLHNGELFMPNPPRLRHELSDRYFLNKVNPRSYSKRLIGSLVQSSTFRSEATFEVPLLAKLNFSFEVRGIEGVQCFSGFFVRFLSLLRIRLVVLLRTLRTTSFV